MWRLIVLTLGVACGCSCNLVGPSCVARQERGTVTAVTGEVTSGETSSHLVGYETRGSQNDAEIRWDGDRLAGGPRIAVYATRSACVDFRPDAASGACAILGRAGTISGGHLARTLVITNGRGNPDVLGQPAEYKLWIVGDPEQNARYTITITWFFGPDC